MTLHRIRTLCRALPLAAALLSCAAFAQGTAPAAPAAPAASAPAAGNAEKEAAGRLAATGWLTLLDRRDWGRAWETSAALFRSTVPLGTWMDGIPKVREPLGALVERNAAETLYTTESQGLPLGDYVSVVFKSRYDKQQITEMVTTVREADGRWRVTGYGTR